MMNRGRLADYFVGVAAKRLTQVEVDQVVSNQHEFNGTAELRRLLGTPTEKRWFDATLIYLDDSDDDPEIESARMSWYDSRRNKPKRSPEWRLYFPDTIATDCASPGDTLIIARKPDDSLLVIIAEDGTTVANQVQWLFGVGDLSHPGFSLREELETQQDRLGLTHRLILESIGIEVEVTEETELDRMLGKFGRHFPKTKAFSSFVREVVGEVDAINDPDGTLMAWMTKEEILFRTLEKELIAEKLSEVSPEKFDDFIAFSLSVQNRRKSRVGWALENHLAALFDAVGLQYSRGKKTENNAKPDFLFPGITEYRDPVFDSSKLTMLGAKSTCKDRWRQVLAEAARIERKHLLTLEAAISKNQTDEMKSNQLALVLPRSLHTTYSPEQRLDLLSVADFIALAQSRK